MKEQWKETKNDFEIEDDGRAVLKKITKEKEISYGKRSKETWLFIFQATSSFGIIFAFLGIIVNIGLQQYQNKNQLKQQDRLFENQLSQQRTLFKIGIYSRSIGTMGVLTNRSIEDSAFYRGAGQIMNDIRPHILLLNDDSLIKCINSFDTLLKQRIYFYALLDSVKIEEEILKRLTSLYNDNYSNNDRIRPQDILPIYNIYNRVKILHIFFSQTSLDWKKDKHYYLRTLIVASKDENFYEYIAMHLDTFETGARNLKESILIAYNSGVLTKAFNKSVTGGYPFFTVEEFKDTCASFNRSITDSMRCIREVMIPIMQRSNDITNK